VGSVVVTTVVGATVRVMVWVGRVVVTTAPLAAPASETINKIGKMSILSLIFYRKSDKSYTFQHRK